MVNPGGDRIKTAFSRSLDMAEEGTPTEEGATVSRGQHWTDEEVAALLDVWSDDKIQAQLKGAYRNDAVMKKIAAGIVSQCTSSMQHAPSDMYNFDYCGGHSDDD